MKRVAVVILNWNGRNFLEQFLPGVVANSPDWCEIIVADKASTDDSVSWLNTHYPHVRQIHNSSNGGFAKGYNDALRQVNTEYFVLLNSDVGVAENWIEPVIALMDSDVSIAAAQPKIRAFHHPQQFEYAGAAGGFIDKWGFPFCRGRIFDSFETDTRQYNDACDLFWATGAALFVRRSDWVLAQGLDEDFFAHMEEIDLCWRLRNLGKRICYCPDSVVYHVGGGTLSKQSPRKTFLNFRNNLVLLTKNHAPGFFALKIFLRLCIDGIAGVRFLVGGDIGHCAAVLRAHFSFYGALPKTLRKRRALKAQIKNYATSGIYLGSIVKAYFLNGKKKFTDLDPAKFSR